MKKFLAIAVIVGGAMLATATVAKAAFIPTTSSFLTESTPGTFTFTFLGSSALDVDTMHFVFNGQTIFVNDASPPGSLSISVSAPGTFQLSLLDSSVLNTWSSDPALNSDGLGHLASNLDFTAFGIVAPPGGAGSGPFYGWEDRPFPGADADFNDLVFTVAFTPALEVPEPGGLVLLGTGILGLSVAARRRRA